MSLELIARRIGGKKSSPLVPLDVSGQSPTGGSGGTDRPILIGGRWYRFNCVDETWSFQRSIDFPNLLRSEVRPGYLAPYDDSRDREYLRSEITAVDRVGNTGLVYWISFAVYLLDASHLQPYPPISPPGQAMLCQIKSYPDIAGTPAFRIEARDNCVRIVTSSNRVPGATGDITVDRYLGPPIKERVFDNFLTRFQLSADGLTGGSCETWRNGAKIIDDHNIAMGRADRQYIWQKFGLYCRDTVAGAATIHANMFFEPDLSNLLTKPHPLPNIAY